MSHHFKNILSPEFTPLPFQPRHKNLILFADYNPNRTVREECKSIKPHQDLLPYCRRFTADSLHHGSLHLRSIENKLLDSLQRLSGAVAVQTTWWFCRTAENGPGSSSLNHSICKSETAGMKNQLPARQIDEYPKGRKLDVNFKVDYRRTFVSFPINI